MNFNEIKTEKPLAPITLEEIKSLEEELWIKLPAGYSEIISYLGEGVLAKTIRIYPPHRIHKDLENWRQRIKKYWFWDGKPQLLPKERALEAIIIGDTLYGDEIVFHPNKPDKLFIVQSENDKIILAGNNLFTVVKYIQSLMEDEEDENSALTFEPFDSRNSSNNLDFDDEVKDPTGESIEEIIKLGQQWEIRHSARKQAKASLKKQLTPKMNSSLIQEGIYMNSETEDIGYFIQFLVTDIENGKKVGVFEFSKNSQSWGSSWTPNSVNNPIT